MQVIASYSSGGATKGGKSKYETTYKIKKTAWECCLLFGLLESGRQDSNLRPSAPKALNSSSEALGFQAITTFLLSSA